MSFYAIVEGAPVDSVFDNFEIKVYSVFLIKWIIKYKISLILSKS